MLRIIDSPGPQPEDLSESARIFLEHMSLSRETIQLVAEAQFRGINVDRILKGILYLNKRYVKD